MQIVFLEEENDDQTEIVTEKPSIKPRIYPDDIHHGEGRTRGQVDDDSIDDNVVTEMSVTQENPNVFDKSMLYIVSGIVGGSVFLFMCTTFIVYKCVVSRKQTSNMH